MRVLIVNSPGGGIAQTALLLALAPLRGGMIVDTAPVVLRAPPELPEFRTPYDVARKSKGEKRRGRAERRRKGWR